jgi:hypothetical protein
MASLMRDKNMPDTSLMDLDHLTKEVERFKKLSDQLQIEVDNYKDSTALKEEQLERAERNLKELQKNIVKENEGVRKQLNEFTQNEKMKEGLQMNEITRNFQERDKKLFEKLKELADGHEPLLAVKKKSLKDLKDDKDGLVVNTVRIFYHKNLKEGDDRRVDQLNPYAVAVRISHDTTFQQLKEFACDYWNIDNPDIFSIRAPNLALLDLINKPVETLIREQKMRPEFWIYERNLRANKIFTEPETYFIEESYKSQFKKEAVKKKKRVIGEEGKQINYTRFLMEYKGLQLYMPPKAEVNEQSEKNRLTSRDMSCPTLVMVLITFLMSIYINVYSIDLTASYWIANNIASRLQNEYYPGKRYDQISSMAEIPLFVDGPLIDLWYSDTPELVPLTIFLQPVGPMRIRLLRTKEIECNPPDFDIEDIECFESKYKEQSWMDEDIGDGSETWMVFQTGEENNQESNIYGEFSKYDGSGYTYDAYYNKTNGYSQFKEFISNVSTFNWFDQHTRAVIITFTFYSPSQDLWALTNLLIEISVTGVVKPNYIAPMVFHPNLQNIKNGDTLFNLIVFRFLFCIYYLYLFLRDIFTKNELGKFNFKHIYSIRGLFDLTTFALSIVVLALASSIDEDESIINDQEFYDLYKTAQNFRKYIIINSYLLLFIFMRLLLVLRINRRLHLLLLAIEIASKSILFYLIFIMPLMIAFCFLSMSIWGPYEIYYRSIGWSMFNNVILTLGTGNMLDLYQYNAFWTIVYIIIYVFFVWFFLISAFTGIYMDTYRLVRGHEGYRDDVTVWYLSDYIIWVLGFLPKSKVKYYIDKYLEARKEKENKRKHEKQKKLQESDEPKSKKKEEESNKNREDKKVKEEKKKTKEVIIEEHKEKLKLKEKSE